MAVAVRPVGNQPVVEQGSLTTCVQPIFLKVKEVVLSKWALVVASAIVAAVCFGALAALSVGAIGALIAWRTNSGIEIDVCPTGKWRITSKWSDELAEKVVHFLTNNAFEFYTTGRAPAKEAATNLVKGARDRAEAGIPFTRYPVLDMQNNVIGEFAMGFSEDPRKLEIAGRGILERQNQGIGREVLDWALHKYIPELHAKGQKLPVFAGGQDGVAWKDKKVVEWVDLKDVSVLASVHPDYEHCNHLLKAAGFVLKEAIVKPNFQGVHDGRRNIYEYHLSKALVR